MKTISHQTMGEERALYGSQNILLQNCAFDGEEDGESALKECQHIQAEGCRFALRYPLWHVNDAKINRCTMTEGCRAPLWYCQNITVQNSNLSGTKALRESSNIQMINCEINSGEFGWLNQNLHIENCKLTSDYPFFHSKNLQISHLAMTAKYSFQYVENAVIKDCKFQTKDAFWHAKNVTVYDSVLNGEYLGWYSENLKLVRCRILGTQPLCYCKGLILEDCETEGCDLSFEKSDVNAVIRGSIESIKNPIAGQITADSIGTLILDALTNCVIHTKNK
ncbi:MAG: DUF3737 family protein [Clostridiales bacterium]|nr:DUF3737 family protein [Clostridiales bacterium]